MKDTYRRLGCQQTRRNEDPQLIQENRQRQDRAANKGDLKFNEKHPHWFQINQLDRRLNGRHPQQLHDRGRLPDRQHEPPKYIVRKYPADHRAHSERGQPLQQTPAEFLQMVQKGHRSVVCARSRFRRGFRGHVRIGGQNGMLCNHRATPEGHQHQDRAQDQAELREKVSVSRIKCLCGSRRHPLSQNCRMEDPRCPRLPSPCVDKRGNAGVRAAHNRPPVLNGAKYRGLGVLKGSGGPTEPAVVGDDHQEFSAQIHE